MESLFLSMSDEWEEERGRLGFGFWASLMGDTSRAALIEWFSLTRRAIRSATAKTLGEHMSILMSDVRFGIRQLIRQPLYGLTVMLLMAMGIAGNTAVFRVFNGLFLRPLPFDAPEQLVDLDETAPQWDLEFVSISYPDFHAWRSDNHTFEAMAAYDGGGANFTTETSAQRITYISATHDIDDVLGLEAALGRFFTEEEDIPDTQLVGMVSLGFWEQEFASDPDILGRTVSLNGFPVEIVGVLPSEARFLGEADLWLPMRGDPNSNDGWSYSGIGRLKAGISIEAAREDLLAVHRSMIEERPVNEITSPVINSLRDRYLGDFRLGSGFLLGAVGIVLLIACANIAGLMFARSLARGPEMAVRQAMGAPRTRIIRQLLTESVLLASLGATAGTLLGIWGSGVLVSGMADQFPSWVTFDLDQRFILYSLGITAAAAVLFGLAPALQASGRGGLNAANRSTASTARRRTMNLLVTSEVALALLLLVVGGLSTADVRMLGQLDPGFDADGVSSFSVTLPSSRYADNEARLAFVTDYLARLEALPSVASAAAASTLPLSGHWGWFFEVEGAEPRGEDEPNPVVLNRIVTPGYFATMGVSLAAGRVFDDFDGREEGSRAVIVNESFVRTHLGGDMNAIGRRIHTGGESPWMTIVGVARDVKHYGVDEEMRPGVYQPLRQFGRGSVQVALKAAGSSIGVVADARRVTAELDPELPLYGVQSMEDRLSESLWTRRATSWLIATFSTIALLLAVAGLYGVISYSVGQRTQEISIRMAMGAQKRDVLRQVLRQGMGLVVIGVGIGLLGSLAAAGLVSGILVGVSATNPVVYGAVTIVLLGVAVLANYLPARRAAALDPMRALRQEL